jgi:SET domain
MTTRQHLKCLPVILCWICCRHPVASWILPGTGTFRNVPIHHHRGFSTRIRVKNNDNQTGGNVAEQQQQDDDDDDVTKSITRFQAFLQDIFHNLLSELDSDAFVTQQTMLRTRLKTFVCHKTLVGPSTVPQAGRGLFALRDCVPGEILTCYPGDALLLLLLEDDKYEYFGSPAGEPGIIWGDHVVENLKVAYDESSPLWQGYQLGVSDKYAVLGLPSLDNGNPSSYLGHFANDACRPIGGERGLASYVLKSQSRANAMHQTVDDLHMATVAMRPICEGEEIFVSYGPVYWSNNCELVDTNKNEVQDDYKDDNKDDDDDEWTETDEIYEDDYEFDDEEGSFEIDWEDDMPDYTNTSGKGFG